MLKSKSKYIMPLILLTVVSPVEVVVVSVAVDVVSVVVEVV